MTKVHASHALPSEVWCSIISFSECPLVGRVICAGKWCYGQLPEHVSHLSLKPMAQMPSDPDDYKYDASLMIVEAKIPRVEPRSYLHRFHQLRILEVDLWDEKSYDGQDTMYYLATGGALGSLLETGLFHELHTLSISTGVYHTGCLVKPRGKFNKKMYSDVIEDPNKAFHFYGWVQQLALTIVRAFFSGKAPKLFQISILDNFGVGYFCPNHEFWRRSDELQTQYIRNQLAHISSS